MPLSQLWYEHFKFKRNTQFTGSLKVSFLDLFCPTDTATNPSPHTTSKQTGTVLAQGKDAAVTCPLLLTPDPYGQYVGLPI